MRKMVLLWISITDKLQAGIRLINALSPTLFANLLKRIITTKDQNIFTLVEMKELEESLSLNGSNLELLIQSIAFIYKQASKVILKPADLQTQLIEDLQFERDKAEEFIKYWAAETKNYFGDIKKLEKVSYELNLQTSSSSSPKQNIPNVRLQLGLSSVTDNKSENVTVELNENDLSNFCNVLEVIQKKIDFIQSL